MIKTRTYAHALGVTGFSILLLAAAISPANAADAPTSVADVPTIAEPAVAAPATTRDLAATPVTITLTFEGKDSNYTTEAKTFGDFLGEIGFHVGADDYLSQEASTPLTDGMRAEYRAAVPLTVVYGKRTLSLHTSALTLDEAIANARIGIGPRDVFSIDRRSLPREGEVVRITHPKMAKARVTAQRTTKHAVRKVAFRPVHKRSHTWHHRSVHHATLVAKAVPHAMPSIVSRLASTGISSAMHLAGSVLHVIATAYIAGCYKCSGITASGMHAGFGIIAVDPHLIPLGTKLMIPGYGRAIAGDTGGAIVGHRVDLGMNTLADALRFGRRSMTVYVLK